MMAGQKTMNSTLPDKPRMVFASIFCFSDYLRILTDFLCRARQDLACISSICTWYFLRFRSFLPQSKDFQSFFFSLFSFTGERKYILL